MRHRSTVVLFGLVALGGCSRSPVAVPPPTPPVDAPAVVVRPAVEMGPTPTLVATDNVPDGGSFPFPDEVVAKALTPRLPADPAGAVPAAPKPRRLPAFLDAPTPPLPDSAGAPPRLSLTAAKPARPTPLPERVPDLAGSAPFAPARSEVASGPLTKTVGRDVNLPADLPTLSATPVPDRAPLTDPTREFTAASAISPTLPLRVDPTGFLRITLPDPFEHSEAARPRTPVELDANKSLPTLPPPKR